MATAAIPGFLSQTQLNFSLLPSPKPLTAKLNRCFRRRKSVRCCLNLPLELKSQVGRSLSSVLQNQPQSFYDVVSLELNRIVDDRHAAFARFHLSIGTSEASLHRRIAELKEAECQVAVEDVLYAIILYKFSEIRVPLAPSLSKCLYNGRLEILPSKDWELESIHSIEVLEMVREHLSTVLGWKVGSSVSVNWSTTKIRKNHLSKVYEASILYGYFLKSASLRLCLEKNLPPTHQNLSFGSWTPPPEREPYGSEDVSYGHMITPRCTALGQVSRSTQKTGANLRCYVTGFDRQTMEECTKLKSEEAVELIKNHCLALFGDIDAGNNDMISTSLSSLKRLVLEAVAYGCFLWDAEQCVNSIYKLKERS